MVYYEIVGNGLVAKALTRRSGVIQYASGVSNSRCDDAEQFKREEDKLTECLRQPGLFVYFGTCSTDDTAYTRHKFRMESLVKDRAGDFLICRLPVVAGKSENPYTLLNFMASRIRRGERFDLWTKATRHVIDVQDAAKVVNWLIREGANNETVNIAPPHAVPVTKIVNDLERAIGKLAMFTPIDDGTPSVVDVSRIVDAPVWMGGDYVGEVIHRYYA